MKKALSILKPHGHSHAHETTANGIPRASTEPTHGSASMDSSRKSLDTRKSIDVRKSVESPAGSSRTSRDGPRPSLPLIGGLRNKFTKSSDSEDDKAINGDADSTSKNQLKKHERKASKERNHEAAKERENADRRRRLELEQQAIEEETEDQRAKYGVLPPNSYAGVPDNELRVDLTTLSTADIGKWITFRARIQNIRKISAHLTFLALRQQTTTIQGVMHEHAGVSHFMVYWAEHLHSESVVRVRGVIQEPKAKQGEIIGCSIHDLEISIHELHVEAEPTEPLPFHVYEAEISQKEAESSDRHRISDRTRMANRIVDLRTTSSQSIFHVQSEVSTLFREYLRSQKFIEIHTPKLQGGATESGASVFKVDYFGRPAFLAQSPQLAKQMCMSADFRRVFEIGAVFRAENSNTHRHMTEYTGLDLEMEIDEHYHEVLRVLDNCFKSIFKGVYERCRG